MHKKILISFLILLSFFIYATLTFDNSEKTFAYEGTQPEQTVQESR